MAHSKNALIRQRVLDRCLRGPKHYTLKEMMDKCNDALEFAGFNTISSKNTILSDFSDIERDFPGAKIMHNQVGRYVYYWYEDPDFSVYNIPIDDDGMAKLAQTISILSKFEGMPNFDWVDDMIDHFKLSLDIPTTKESVVAFDDNPMLHNRTHFSTLFSSIVTEQPLAITYEPFGKEPKVYKIHPYFLKQFNNRWFLFCAVDGKQGRLYNFPFDRISNIEKAFIPFVPNTTYNFDELFKNIVGVSNLFDEPEIIQFKVSSESVNYIVSKPILPCQKQIPSNEEIIFEIKTVINRELIQLLLSYGSAITVLKPQRLIDEITSSLKKNLENYQSVQSQCTHGA
ncbi:YafY family protein [uncultured Phocaeicola sp.]|jgi:hypothetical protein|uniref:helix-turn-helix transcriptional regulator n=1 Tax=uncultured Phocaeicola sp. TaxID=990718 RepID=UPI0026235DA4|nr:WYL domain-containing protein [uncultured Phocaeicola sp.]